MDKKHMYSALMIIGVVAAVAAFQKHVMAVPVLGAYLPGAPNTPTA
jgi:hypothetical protein